MHYSADLQSVHGFRCYDNIAPNASMGACTCSVPGFNCQEIENKGPLYVTGSHVHSSSGNISEKGQDVVTTDH